ncbi:conserved hypothetical protein [Pedosphaera parvula Ellin514]|uniref:MobA-like NTP transferase domain-containing protein n=2 Tax=Pedosphaera TaxID=1032526 RepID=B9XC04_PEDPL|nr:conserved hypothetical protein [Pedosphaera parvula Ellin514]
MTHELHYPFAAIILAAGSSTRMGRPKLLLPWRGTTMLGHLLQLWSDLGTDQVTVVTSANDRPIDAELERLEFPLANRIVNPNPERGMFSSIHCAAKWQGWKPGISHWAVVLGDQPHLQQGTLQKLVSFAQSRPNNICQPARAGKPKHPVFLPSQVFREVANSRAETLKIFLTAASARIELLELDDAGLDLDIDYPKDYERALKLCPLMSTGPDQDFKAS